MWSVQQTWKLGRRAAGFLGGLLVALLLVTAPAAAALDFTISGDPVSNGGPATNPGVALTTSAGQIYIAWREGSNIFFSRSLQSGSSCSGSGGPKFSSPAQPLSTLDATKFTADLPSIAVNGSDVFVAWQEVPVPNTGGVQTIGFRRSTDGGATFNLPEVVRSNQVNPTNPAVAADSGGVFVAWQEVVPAIPFVTLPTTSVLVAQSLNGGAFSSATVHSVTRSPVESFQPSVATDGTTVHVVWRETATTSRGLWYKGYARSGGPATVGSAIRLTANAASNPRLAVQGTQLKAAWFEGSSIKAGAMTNGSFSVDAAPIHSSTLPLSNLSLSFGSAGRLVAWRETDMSIFPFTRSIRYFVEGATSPVTLRSGNDTEMNLAAPSFGQDGTDRAVAAWRENGGAGGTEIRFAYAGDFGSGGTKKARVWSAPAQVNFQSMKPGPTRRPNLTVFIEPVFLPGELEDWSAADIYASTVTLNGKSAIGPSSLADHDGNGKQDLMVKFDRSDLVGAQYEVRGDMKQPAGSKGCPFSGILPVEITP